MGLYDALFEYEMEVALKVMIEEQEQKPIMDLQVLIDGR